MKRFLLRFVVIVIVIAAGIVTLVSLRFSSRKNHIYAKPQFSISAEVAAADLALGKRIFNVRSGCIDCHGENLAGAKIMENGAMGTIHGANITPYALKDWSDEDIARAIRYGIHKEGRSLRFMPSFDYASLSKGDVAALIAYIRSASPVETPSHENTYGPIARMLSAFDKMPVMFPAAFIDQTQDFAAKPSEGPTREFGVYLANTCIGCHGEHFAGGPIPGGDPSWPPASNIRLGANPIWTKDSFAGMIKTGVSPTSGQALRPPMPVHLLRQLDESEITALWEYLSTLN